VKRLNKKVLGITLSLLLIAMLAVTIFPVLATQGTPVSGKWVGVPSSNIVTLVKTVGGNIFMDCYNKGIYTQGDILGTFEQTFNATAYYGSPYIVKNLDPTNPANNPDAAFIWKDMDRTFTGTVLGVSGEFTMRLQAKGYGNQPRGGAYFDLDGTWVIIDGSGGLEGLHGQGTWWHSRTGPAGLEYEGLVHFDP
jgi:hypothetical protein